MSKESERAVSLQDCVVIMQRLVRMIYIWNRLTGVNPGLACFSGC